MVWDSDRMLRALTALGLMGAALGVVMPAAADTIVVRASGPSAKTYPPGKKLAESGSLALKSGDVITLLDPRGTRTLRGPGSYTVAGAANAATGNAITLAAMLDTKRVRRARTGAVRGALNDGPTVTRRPNLWLVDVAQSGSVCVADPATVRLWRADSAAAASFGISGTGGRGTVTFGAGESLAAWPAALTVTDGAIYRLSGSGAPVEMRFALVAAAGTGLDATAATLIAHQCKGQLDVLIETAALPDPAPGS